MSKPNDRRRKAAGFPVWHKGCLGRPIRNGEGRLWNTESPRKIKTIFARARRSGQSGRVPIVSAIMQA